MGGQERAMDETWIWSKKCQGELGWAEGCEGRSILKKVASRHTVKRGWGRDTLLRWRGRGQVTGTLREAYRQPTRH